MSPSHDKGRVRRIRAEAMLKDLCKVRADMERQAVEMTFPEPVVVLRMDVVSTKVLLVALADALLELDPKAMDDAPGIAE